MPEQGIELQPRSNILSFSEIVQAAELLADMGVSKIRITGGEPLVRKNIPELVARLKAVPGIQTVGMTTNGVLLSRYAAELKHAGLDALNISLDSLRRERFEHIARRAKLDDVLSGIEDALTQDFGTVKINTVVIRGFNDDELLDFVGMAGATGMNVRFIEYMPFAENQWNSNGFIGFAEMREAIGAEAFLRPLHSENPHAVAKDFEIVGKRGLVSFITSMSEHFCSSCNRIRLTADGCIKACLFSHSEYSIREALRMNDLESVQHIIQSAIQGKAYQHAPMEELVQIDNRSMIRIGG